MAEAFSGGKRTSYKYQYSVTPGIHGINTLGYLGSYGSVAFLSEDFQSDSMSEHSYSRLPQRTVLIFVVRYLGQLYHTGESISFEITFRWIFELVDTTWSGCFISMACLLSIYCLPAAQS
jgi:hypothetical protein